MRSIFKPLAAVVLLGSMARPAAAGLIGDTVTLDSFFGAPSTQAAVIGTTPITFTNDFGFPFTADFTANSLTLLIDHPTFSLINIPFIFSFANTDITGLRYLSGTLPPPPPPQPDPCAGITDPSTSCTGFVLVTAPLEVAAGVVDNPHMITIDISAVDAGPDRVTFEIDSVPEPSSLALLAAPFAILAAVARRRWRIAPPTRA